MSCKACHPQPTYKKPKVLFLDTETSPGIGAYYQRWDTDILWSVEEWRFLCFSYAWNDCKVQNVHNANEKKMVFELWGLLDEADLVVTHNVSFDVGKAYAKFLEYHMEPPRPFKTFCTLQKYRKLAKMESNKLGELGVKLGFGEKVGLEKNFWRKVMNKDKKSIKKMITYCNHDVWLLRKIYYAIEPFFAPMKFRVIK